MSLSASPIESRDAARGFPQIGLSAIAPDKIISSIHNWLRLCLRTPRMNQRMTQRRDKLQRRDTGPPRVPAGALIPPVTKFSAKSSSQYSRADKGVHNIARIVSHPSLTKVLASPLLGQASEPGITPTRTVASVAFP